MKLKYIVILLMYVISIPVLSQTRIGVTTDVSKILVHTSTIQFEAPPLSTGIMFSANRATNPKNITYALRGLPFLGFDFYILNYGNPHLGQAIGLLPHISFPYQLSTRWSHEITISLGLGYATKFYSRIPWSDTMYNALGSHWNNMTRLSENLYYHIGKQSELNLSLSFTHVSSASASQPNYGINSLGIGLGYTYHLDENKKYGRDLEEAFPAKKRNAISLGYGVTSDRRIVGVEFPVYILKYTRQWIDKYRMANWYLGAEGVYNTKFRTINSATNLQGDSQPITDYLALYLSMGREWYLGRAGLDVGLNLGYSTYSKKFDHLQKFTAKYYPFVTDYSTQNLAKNTYLGIGLTTNLFNAQYIEFTLGSFF